MGSPIGKQDQYAASYGGFNVIEFYPDESVHVQPILLGFRERQTLKKHLLLFYTGITREANTVLSDQRNRVEDNIERYKQMTESIPLFEKFLFNADMEGAGKLLHEGWLAKKQLGAKVTNKVIDSLYEEGIKNGAWGGKVLGAGGGGCILFVAPPEKHTAILNSLTKIARKAGLNGFQEIPFTFTDGGADIIANHLYD